MHTPARGRRCRGPALWSAAVVMLLAGSAVAQPLDGGAVTSLSVPGTPEGILSVAGFTAWDGARAGLFLDLVRHLYAAPDADSPAVQAVRRHVRTVSDFMEAWRVVRAAEGSASLAHAGDRRARRRLEDLVEAAGFRLRRSSGEYAARVDDGDSAQARRASLRAAGLTVDDLDRRLNAGEAVAFELPAFDVPLPLTAGMWRDTVLRSRAGDGELLGLRILGDRRAALLYHGLLSMPAGTRRFLAANPRLLRDMYEDHAERLALYGRGLAVAGDRVAVPGGADAESLWRSLTSERVDRPDDFIKAVLRQDDGTLAYFYDVMAHLDEPHRRFALNLWLDEGRRRSRWWRLYDVFLAQAPVLPERPFNRLYPDPAVLISTLAVDASGRPAPPAWRELWEEVFSGTDLPGNPERDVRGVTESELVDAGWLAERVFERPELVDDRVHALGFAQRRFADAAAAELPDVLVALRGFSRFRALVLTLERTGVRRPAVYAAALRRAARIDTLSDPERRARTLSQFQGVLALVERARYSGALTDKGAESLVSSAVAVEPDRDREYAGGIADWISSVLIPALGTEREGEAAPKEDIVLEALAGRGADGGAPPRVLVPWEGFDYVADLGGATRARLVVARRAQGGNSLDVALELSAVAAALAVPPDTIEAVHAAARDLESLDGRLVERAAPGSVTVAEYLSRARRDLQAIREPRRIGRAEDVGRRLLRLADALVGDVLRSLVYAGLVGDPGSGVLDGGDLAAGHDFGVRIPDGDERRRAAWRLPVARATPDRPWYAHGALLGLDLATANLRLSQVVTSTPPVREVLDAYDRRVAATGVALFSPFDKRQEQLDAVAAAVGAGRARVARLSTAAADAGAVATAAGLSARRRTLLDWMLANEPHRAAASFSPQELFWLGWPEDEGAGRAVLRLWGAPAWPVTGCLCLESPPAGSWEHWIGAPGSGIGPTLTPDLLVWVAAGLGARGLPPSIGGDVLQVAMRHLLDRVRARHPDDWTTVARYPSTLAPADLDDFVSALTGTGILMPANDPSSLDRP